MSSRFFLFVGTITLLACNPLKKIPEGQYFLHKSKVETDSGSFKREDLINLLRQKSNRKILGVVRLHLGLYTIGNTGDTTVTKHKGLGKLWNGKKIKRGLRKIGEEPVILDTALTEKSREQLEIYAQSKGYFDAVVTDSIYLKKKKAKVVYTIHSHTPYKVRNISYASSDEAIQQILSNEVKNSEIDSGEVYDADVMDEERNRVTAAIRDYGYYFFNRNFITYELDSTLGSHQVDVYMYGNRMFENVDPATAAQHPQEDHHKYRLNNIFIIMNYNSLSDQIGTGLDTVELSDYYFLDDTLRDYLRKEFLLRFVFMKKGDLFYQKDVDYTYTRLAELNLFQFINFRFVEVHRDSLQPDYLLDVYLQLTPLKNQEYKLESELTHNGGNLGIAGSVTYANKNLLRGAESLELKLSGGLEALRNFADSNVSKKLLFFNTFDFGPEVSVGFKRFLIPGFIERNTSRYFNPKTLLTVGTNYQERPDFKRIITKFSFGYQWQPSMRQKLQYYPFEINSVNVRNSPDFEETLLETGDQSLIYSYKNHLITSGRFNWAFTNQGSRITRNYYFLRTNIETAGNTLYWYSYANNAEKDSSGKRYTVYGNIFSQYVKVDADLVYHMRINFRNKIVYRIAGGVGYTYGNSENLSLPFDKAFFIGGANDLRAWHARTLGPGSYEDPSNIENGGDIKILSNIEYRSALFKRIEAALFVDAGNVWLLNDKQTTLEGALFNSKTFLSEIAVGAGVGIRLNFNFFIIRTDFGLKLVNPALPGSNRWEYANHKFVLNQIVANLAIGYPF